MVRLPARPTVEKKHVANIIAIAVRQRVVCSTVFPPISWTGGLTILPAQCDWQAY